MVSLSNGYITLIESELEKSKSLFYNVNSIIFITLIITLIIIVIIIIIGTENVIVIITYSLTWTKKFLKLFQPLKHQILASQQIFLQYQTVIDSSLI